MPGDVTVPSFGPKMVCTRCGIIGADARPNWQEQPARPSPTGNGLIEREPTAPSEPGCAPDPVCQFAIVAKKSADNGHEGVMGNDGII